MSKGNSPAFPCQDSKKQIWTGMNLRDYFALEAMNALIKKEEPEDLFAESIAAFSYKIADAMLTERENYK
jgi:hypothetical protein